MKFTPSDLPTCKVWSEKKAEIWKKLLSCLRRVPFNFFKMQRLGLLKSQHSNLWKRKFSLKIKILKFGTKMPYLGTLGCSFKIFGSFWNQYSLVNGAAKFRSEIKKIKFGTKNFLFGSYLGFSSTKVLSYLKSAPSDLFKIIFYPGSIFLNVQGQLFMKPWI